RKSSASAGSARLTWGEVVAPGQRPRTALPLSMLSAGAGAGEEVGGGQADDAAAEDEDVGVPCHEAVRRRPPPRRRGGQMFRRVLDNREGARSNHGRGGTAGTADGLPRGSLAMREQARGQGAMPP